MRSSYASRNTRRTSHQQDQLRRFLYPSLSSTDSLPLLLPLSQSQEKNAEWIALDLECQLLVYQAIRIAIQPWYSKLTNDRQLYEEVINVLSYGLRNVKTAMLQSNGDTIRLERLLLYDMPSLLRNHYIEVRRALALSGHQEGEQGERAAASIFLASNPHPALFIDTQSHLQVDEDYIDLLLLAILQGFFPKDHLSSHNESLLLIDIIKGVFRGQSHLHGSGAWVVVRLMLSLIDTSNSNRNETASPSVTVRTSRWDYRANLTLGLNLVCAIFKTLFLYLAVFYLDLFTPISEPKKRKRRKESETEKYNGWDLHPALDVIVEGFLWRDRITTRLVEEWLRIGLAWGGSYIIERQVKNTLLEWVQPEQMRGCLAELHKILVEMPNQPPPEPVKVSSRDVQKQEFDLLVNRLLKQVQQFRPIALLLGYSEAMQRQSIEASLAPFLEPPLDSTYTGVVQVANAKLLLSLLERFALLVNPALEQ